MTPDTLLYRQVHPSWVRNGRIASLAFLPTPKDGNRLSVYDGDQISAADAWQHYVNVLGLASDGVAAVNREECERHQVAVISDPLPDFPEHALIDFTGLSRNGIKRVAQRLRAAADVRGWLFSPDGSMQPNNISGI
jgi:hypothetical protein